MEITDFYQRVQNSNASPLVRSTTQLVKSLLNENCGLKEIEVTNEVFDELQRVTRSNITHASVCRFMRVFDMNENSVDIQTKGL